MTTYAAIIEYQGAGYHGWQKQRDQENTIQAHLERAVSFVADEVVRVYCGGRTDAGVHGCGQVVHFYCDKHRSLDAWMRGINSNLPRNITVVWLNAVPEDFHARYRAQDRSYRYIIHNRATLSANLYQQVTWVHQPLNEDLMFDASRHLLGVHDFNAFRAISCQAKSPIREIKAIELNRFDDFVVMDIVANGFLYHMVRNIMGVLIRIGMAEKPAEWAKQVLESKSRLEADKTAPADGLYLCEIKYPAEYMIPKPQWKPKYW